MPEILQDQRARERFRDEWQVNFAVSANAGSGKTTAISERLASMALSEAGARALSKTAVVTYTKKAAAQIGQKARQVLLRRLEAEGRTDLSPLDSLERAFFGTIHSFCLLLAQRYGQPHGLNLNPRLLAEGEDDEKVFWEEFLEQDDMTFRCLAAAEVDVLLRFVEMEKIFEAAKSLNASSARQLLRRRPAGPLPEPNPAGWEQLQALPLKGSEATRKKIERTQGAAGYWKRQYDSGSGFIGLFESDSSAKAIVESVEAWMAPLKPWLADAAAALAGEMAERYREYRRERGVQTYADQIDVAMSVLHDQATLERIRADGWRVILDEAQDTDSQQFAVLVEITRPVGAEPGTWPDRAGAAPRAGHFCLVGDGQQAIYRARADIRNFVRHLNAFERGDGGELLVFRVTFRTPRTVVDLLNRGFPAAFGPDRPHNLGLAPAEGVVGRLLQVNYEPLEAGPLNEEGRVEMFPLAEPATQPGGVDGWLAEEARQVAAFLRIHGPGAVGALQWGEVCVLAPRNDWLAVYREELEKAGLKTALQVRRNRSGDNPAYAWLAGLLAVVCNPEDGFEWFGVLREIFGVSDALLAVEHREKGGFLWEEPERHPEQLCWALSVVRPWILKADDEGLSLAAFANGLAESCRLREKADAIDPGGAIRMELQRLIASAAAAGNDGAGPRQWFRSLVDEIDMERAGGKPQRDAINLLSSHSAKGLEWPVVVLGGFWRGIADRTETGLCLIPEPDSGGQRVYLKASHVPPETTEARERERVRELVRLLYVTFTRAKKRLVIPWGRTFGTGRRKSQPSFAELWGAPELIEALPVVGTAASPEEAIFSGEKTVNRAETAWILSDALQAGLRLPQRLLPHQLAQKEDRSRAVRHESSLDQAVSNRLSAGDEAIDYGVWWHETMEFTPWTGAETEIKDYWAGRLVVAEAQGFRERGEAELERLRKSETWRELRSEKWKLAPEWAVFSPLENGAWIDGVIDLVMHDETGRRVWILDWKTNHRRAMESDAGLMQRLAEEYAPQLKAYGESLRRIMPDCAVRLLVYSSFSGLWTEIAG